MFKTYPENRNLNLYDESSWRGLSLQSNYAPFFLNYLESMLEVLRNAVTVMRRLLVIRFDLHLPNNDYDSESLVSRFTASLKSQLEANYKKRLKENQKAHYSPLAYIWTREEGLNNKSHYHFVVLLNLDAYATLGTIPRLDTINPQQFNGDNMACRIIKAWASALNINAVYVYTLVHFPQNCTYKVGYLRGELDTKNFEDMFYRLSYLAKAQTKVFGNHVRNFGTSQLLRSIDTGISQTDMTA